MKDKRLSIVINAPAKKVFNYTLDPQNTPTWIDGIEEENTNETPQKVGTIYRNKGSDGKWNEYKLTQLEKNKLFELSRVDGDYHVRYTFTPIDNISCKFEYYEWIEQGELDDTVSQDVLIKLKQVIEAK